MKTRNINFVYEYETPYGPLWGGLDIKDYPEIFTSILNGEHTNLYNHNIRIDETKYHFANSIYSHTLSLLKKYTQMYKHNREKYNVNIKHISEVKNNSDEINVFLIFSVFYYTIDKQLGRSTSILESLSLATKEKLKKNKNFHLWIVDEWEGSYYIDDNFKKNISIFCKKYGIENHKIIYSNCNNFIQKNKPVCKFFPINPYILTGSSEDDQDIFGKSVSSVKLKDLDFNLKRKYKFLSYNRNSSRLHRLLLVSYLYRDNILDSSIVSLYENDYFKNIQSLRCTIDYEGLVLTESDKKIMQEVIEKKYPLHLDFDNQQRAAQAHGYLSEKSHFLDTYFSLVAETSISDDFSFVTEKCIRPILGFQPFIVFGNPHTLKTLQKYGFKTFNSIIDESYDNQFNPKKRFDMAYNEVLKLNKLSIDELHQKYYSIVDILEHNYNLFLEFKDNDSYIHDVLTELTKTIELNQLL